MDFEKESLENICSDSECKEDKEKDSCCSGCKSDKNKTDTEASEILEMPEALFKAKDTEFEQLKIKISLLEAEKDLLIKEQNSKFVEIIEKKSKEAAEILEQKRLELVNKYESEFALKKDYLYEDQLTDLIGIVVQFEKIINYPVSSDEVRNYLSGFQMFLQQFKQILNDFNVVELTPNVGDEFDSTYMTVVKTNEDANGKKNHITEVFSSAYRCKDRYLKLAEVAVCV